MPEFIQQFLRSIIDFFVSGFNFIFGGLADFFFSFLESCGLTIPEIPATVYDIMRELMIGVGYIFPVVQLLPIPFFMITFYTIKLVFALYHLIAGTIIKRVKLKL